MTEQVTTVETTTPAPADPEAAQWADLAKELEADEGVESPQPQPEPEAKEEPAPEPEKAPKQVAAEEHENLKKALAATRASEREARDQLQAFTQAIQDLRQNRQPQSQEQKAEEALPPSLDDDPIAYFKYQNDQLTKRIEELSNTSTKGIKETQQQLRERQVFDAIVSSEQAMQTSTPDYNDVTGQLQASVEAEMKFHFPDDSPAALQEARRLGLESPAQLRAQMMRASISQYAQHALSIGKTPAQYFYELARARGFQPKAPAPAAKDMGKQIIDAAKRGQGAAKTLSGGSGTSGADNPLNIKDLIDLYTEDPDEADRQFEKMAQQGLLG